MAKALKYNYEFYDDINEVLKRVEIWVEGFVGDSTELKSGSTPLRRTYNKDVGEKYLGGVVQTSINIEAGSTDSFQAVEISSPNYGDVIIKHKIADTVLFNAIVVPFEGSDIDLPSTYYNVSLGAECGLNKLASITYTHSGTRKKIIQVIKECLAELPYIDTFPIKVIDSTQVYGTEVLVGTDYWDTYIDDSNFKDDNCLTVIKKLIQVYNEIIFSDGAWYIRNIKEISTQDSDIHTFAWADLTKTTASYGRTATSVARRAGGSFGKLFSQQNIKITKGQSKLRNTFTEGDDLTGTGWTYSGGASLVFDFEDGKLGNSRATVYTPTFVGADNTYVESPFTTFYPFQEFFSTKEKERLVIKGLATKGNYIKHLRLQIRASSGGINHYLTTEGTWYTEVSGLPTPIYEKTYSGDQEFNIDIPQPPYVTSGMLASADRINIGEFGYFNGTDFTLPTTNLAYNIYIRVYLPERTWDDPSMTGDEDYGKQLEVFIEYLRIEKADISGVVQNGFSRNYGVAETKDRKIDFSVELGVGYPSYPSGLDCLFLASSGESQGLSYGELNSLTSFEIDEFIAESYLNVLANQLKFYQGTVEADLEFTDIIEIDEIKYRIHNLEHDSRRNTSVVKLVELNSVDNVVDITPDITLSDDVIRNIDEQITKTLGSNLPIRYVDINFKETTLPTGERVIGLRDDFRKTSIYTEDAFLKASSNGLTKVVTADTEDDFTWTVPAEEANRTFASREYLTETGWLLNGNALTAAKSIGSTTNYDVTLIRNSSTIATLKSTGLHVNNLGTNYLPKHTTGGLADSLAFDNGTNFTIGTNTAIDTYSRLYVFGGANGANVDARPGGGGYDQSIFDAQGSDYATNFNSVHLRYQGVGAVGTTLGYSNVNLADLTYNYASGDRAFLIRSVGTSPIVVSVNAIEKAKFGATTTDFDATTYNFKNGGTTYATLNSTGLGIGTTSPSAKLHVIGNPLFQRTGPSFAEFQRIELGTVKASVGMLGSGEANLSYNMDYTTGLHKYYDSTKEAMWLAMSGGNFAIQYAPSGSVASDIWDDTGNKYLIWGEGATGIVSINTNITDNKGTAGLSIKRNSGQASIGGFGDFVIEGDRVLGTSADIFLNAYNTGNVIITNGGGKLGVGIVNPTQKLHINGTGLVLTNTTSSDGGNVGTIFQGGLGSIFYLSSVNAFRFDTNASEKMRITSSGDIGIGISSPNYKLDVIGTGHFTGAVRFDTVPSSLQDATSANHLVRYSQWIGATYLKPYTPVVKTVSFTSLTKSGLYAINGYTPTAGEYVLDAFGDTGSGIWVVDSGAWSRPTDANEDIELRGFIVSIQQGTYAGYKYLNTNTSAITINTTPITYSEWSNTIETDPIFTSWRDNTRTANTFWAAPNGSNGAATWRALVAADVPTLNQSTTGSAATLTTTRNIAITGDIAWNVDFNGSGNVTAGGTLATVNSNVGTYRSVTVNAKGLVTAATNPTTLTGYGITDAQATLVSGTNIKTVATYSLLGSGDITIASLNYWTKTGSDVSFVGGNVYAPYFEANGAIAAVATTGTDNYTVLGVGSTVFQQKVYDVTNPRLETISSAGVLGTIFNGGNYRFGTGADSTLAKVQVVGAIQQSSVTSSYIKANASGVLIAGTITTSDISNLSSYTGFDARYFTESEIIAGFQPLDADLTAIAEISSTSGLLKKTAANTWSLDTSTYLTTSSAASTYQPLDATLTALAGLNTTTGIVVQTGTDTFTKRTLTGTSGRIVLNFPDGVSGNPVIDISGNYLGQTSISRLGDVEVGTWNATTIAYTRGGTGLTTLGTANQMLRVNSGVTALEYFTPTYISANQTITLSGVVTGSGTTAITTAIADAALSIAKTSGLQTALDGKQATLPSGTAGQFLIRNASAELEFFNLELEPTRLTSNKIAVGDSANYLSDYNNFEFLDSRFISILKVDDSTKSLSVGMYGASNNSFITASGGSLTVKGDSGLIFSNFTGGGTLALTVDNDGRVGVTPLGSGGGGSASLSSTYIGYGSSGNALTGNSKFTFTDGRIITINNGATSSVEFGRKISTDNYGIYVNDGSLELYTDVGQAIDILSNDIYFNTPAGVTKGGIQIDTNLYVVSSGVELNVIGDTALRLLSNTGEITLGNSGTGSLVTIAGTEFKLHLDDAFTGAYTPSNGDKCTLTYDGSKGAFVLQKMNTYNDGTRTYLIL